MSSTAETALASHIEDLLARCGRCIGPERAARAAAVVCAYPEHWRAWRPHGSWDPTLDDLIAYRRALEHAP